MNKFVYLLVFFVLFSCEKQTQLFEIKHVKDKGLELTFFSPKDTSFVIDIKAFGDECYYYEPKGLIIENDKNIDSIACKTTYNQAILVDQNNDMRFLTDRFQLPNEFKELVMINCMEDWSHQIDLKANKPFSLLLEKQYVSDLMVTEKTSVIKIIYLHRNEGDKCASVMESNWTSIPIK